MDPNPQGQACVSERGNDWRVRSSTPYELRHFGAHHLYDRMNLPARVVAVQMGRSNERLVQDLYGHGDVGALEEIDRAFGATFTSSGAREAHMAPSEPRASAPSIQSPDYQALRTAWT